MRKMILTAAAAAAMLSFGASAGHAECASGHAGISKDGSLAPLQQSADAGGGANANAPGSTGTTTGPASGNAQGSGEIAKDGSTAPLASEPGAGTDVATSPQDVQRQQQGEATASAAAKADADASC